MSAEDKKQMNVEGLNSDNPISRKEDDLLGRHSLACRIADLINKLNDDYKESIVIGIEGEWGAGKSSFINLILNLVDPEYLEDGEPTNNVENEEEKRDEAVEANKRNTVIEFNPWNFSDQGELIKDFFGSIAEKFPDDSDNMSSKFKRFVSKLKPSEITLNPSVSVSGVQGSVGEVKWEFNKEEDLGEPLQKQRDEIDAGIKELGKRIIIVIDDIDRLDSDETKLIFKLVKLTANFANTVFLLAYDRNRVGDRLTENNIKGEEYLKKIVQLPFLIPKPAQEDIHGELTKAIERELEYREFQEVDGKRLERLIDSSEFRELFPTIRDVRRYTNSLRLDLKMLGKKELNPVDFVGVEAIRVFAPEVYLAMTNEKTTFTGDGIVRRYRHIGSSQESELSARRKSTFEGILTKAPENLKNSIRDIILQLFPRVEDLYASGERRIGPERFRRRRFTRDELRVCSDEFFDKYFLLSVPSRLLSEVRVGEFLSKANDTTAITEELRGFQKEGKLLLLIKRLPECLDELSPQQQENILMCLFEFADVENTGSENLTRSSVESGLKVLEKRAQLVQKVIESPGMFFVATLLVQELNQNYYMEEYDFPSSVYSHAEEYDFDRLLSLPGLESEESTIGALNKAYIDKVNNAAKDGSLIDSNGLVHTLSLWKKLDEKRAKNYILKLLESKEGLFGFVKGTSQYIDSTRDLKNLIGINELFEYMKKINLNQLTEEEDDMLRRFLVRLRRRYYQDQMRDSL